MLNPNDTIVNCQVKPLPVLLLLDVSGSMSGPKIDALNKSVRILLQDCMDAQNLGECEIQLSIVTFGEKVQRLFPFTRVADVNFTDLTARGGTPLGTAFKMAKAIIDDTDETPRRAYRPLVVLVSDGRPGDKWDTPLEDFIATGRSAKCDRMALAIGNDADESVLGRFIEGTSNPLFKAHSVRDIKNFFKFVSQTTVTRSKSKDPNDVSSAPRPSPSPSPSPSPEAQASMSGGVPPPPYDDDDDEEDVIFT